LISIIVCTMRPSYMNHIFDNYERQAITHKQLIIVINRDSMDIAQWRNKAKRYKNVSVYQLSEKYNLGKCLNFGIGKAQYDVIAKFDDDDYYAPCYLVEAVNTLDKVSASIVGKSTSYIYFEAKKALMIFRSGHEGKYRRHIKGGTLVFRKKVWNKVKFPENIVNQSDRIFLRECVRASFKIYSMSKDNYVCVRRADISSHTQKRSTKDYMSDCKLVAITDDYKPMITKSYTFHR
jgi:hypothetical protein